MICFSIISAPNVTVSVFSVFKIILTTEIYTTDLSNSSRSCEFYLHMVYLHTVFHIPSILKYDKNRKKIGLQIIENLA